MKVIISVILIASAVFWCSCSDRDTGSSEQTIKLYFVASNGNNQQGKSFGCNDVLLELSKTIRVDKTPLESAVSELISAQNTEDYKNFVKGINLMVFQVTTVSGVADVYLTGEFTIKSVCDILRLKEQLYTTANQFSEIKKVNFYINSQPLESYLTIAEKGFQ